MSCLFAARNSAFTRSTVAEIGLDYFGARYFSGAQGRFTSTDPFNVIDLAKSKETAGKFRNYLSNPQHWNKYA